jgi:hypothetical protein
VTIVANETQAQKYIRETAERAVPAAIRAMKYVKIGAWVLLAGTVTGTYMHQHDYLSTQGLGSAAWLFPGVIDSGIFLMMIVNHVTVIKHEARRAAKWVGYFLAALSMTLNALAPGSPVAHFVAPTMVLIAALVELVASLIDIDPEALKATETEAQAQVTTPARRTMSEESKAKAKATREANKLEADRKRAETAERRRLARMVREAEARGDIEASWAGPTAPVSPAPVEWRQDGSYM